MFMSMKHLISWLMTRWYLVPRHERLPSLPLRAEVGGTCSSWTRIVCISGERPAQAPHSVTLQGCFQGWRQVIRLFRMRFREESKSKPAACPRLWRGEEHGERSTLLSASPPRYPSQPSPSTHHHCQPHPPRTTPTTTTLPLRHHRNSPRQQALRQQVSVANGTSLALTARSLSPARRRSGTLSTFPWNLRRHSTKESDREPKSKLSGTAPADLSPAKNSRAALL
jgi:hypothetical protein